MREYRHLGSLARPAAGAGCFSVILVGLVWLVGACMSLSMLAAAVYVVVLVLRYAGVL